MWTDPADLKDVGVEPVKLPATEKPVVNYHDISVEYAIALSEMQRLQPEFIAAQDRYRKAREAMKGFISDSDYHLNTL